MSAGKKFYAKQIDKALASAKEINQEEHPRIVVFSDCHRGNGTWNDSFLNNKTLFQAALGYYRENDFTYIELGDGDELWENRKFSDIEEIHADIFQQFLPFMLDGKMYMVWGNHDMAKSRKAPLSPSLPPCFPAVRICDGSGNIKFNLIHGHQVDPLNNQFWKAARWMVRYLWKPLELAGIKDPTSSARNYKKRKAVEERMADWAASRESNLISGHTHRPTIPSGTAASPASKGKYFNSGSCVHPNTITCLEIIYNEVSLIKWTSCPDENRYLKVCRHVIAGPVSV